ncbi:MAG: alpha/beta fold hydrolase [Dehalococcoidales bacterium]
MAVYVGTSVLGAATAMSIPRLPLIASPASVGLTFQNISFDSRVDKVPLDGWFIPASGKAVLVLINGGFQNRVDPVVDTLGLAHDLQQQGYNILLFDLRGRGDSEGTAHSLSNENKDIGGAIDYLESRGYPADKIGLIGFCSGAANACIFASQNKIGGLVLDACFPSVESMVYNQAANHGITQALVDAFLPAVRVAAEVFYGYKEINPIDVVRKIQCPIFFIHEQDDDLVSTADDVALDKASGNPADVLWEVDATLHVETYRNYPSEYVTKVSEFFNSALSVKDQ